MRILILLLILTTLSSCSNPNGDKNFNDDKNFLFKDFNDIQSFFKRQDTLFCKTSNGVLWYDKIHDDWLLDSIYPNTIKYQNEQTFSHSNFPNGYMVSNYTTYEKQHGSWFLINHGDEGGYPYKQEIIDTSQNKIYRLPYERVKDFIIDNGVIWTGSYFGISKIEIKSLKRTDYYHLPSFKKITAINRSQNQIFYLDYHFGLFKFEKETKNIVPYQKVNVYATDSNYKFSNFFLVDSTFYILCNPMEKCGVYLRGKACILVYNLKTHDIIKVKTNSSFFDSFIKIDNYLVCFGERYEGYEGGAISYFGGAFAFNMKDGHSIDLLNLPIVSLTENDSTLEALSIQIFDTFLTYEKVKLSKNFSFPVNSDIVEKETICSGFDNYQEGDSVDFFDVYYGSKKVIVRSKKFDYYSDMYTKLKMQQPILDSVLYEYPVNHTTIKLQNKRIEMDRY